VRLQLARNRGAVPLAGPTLITVAYGRGSDVVVQSELVGMQTQADLVDLAGALVGEMGRDDVDRENVALEWEGLIGLEGIERASVSDPGVDLILTSSSGGRS
jgi:hypothetical protein